MIDGFVFYSSFYQAVEMLPDTERLAAYDMICGYALTGEEPEMVQSPAYAIYLMAKPQIDKNRVRRENGKSGGRPKKQNQIETKQEPNTNQTETKQEPKGKVKDKVKDKVKEKDINIMPEKPDIMPTVTTVLYHLNEKAGTHFRMSNRQTVEKIKARINDGFTEADLLKVIDNKVADWMGTDMQKFLRPETLFGSKCESYLNEQPKARTRFQNFPARNDQEHRDMVAKLIAMQQ